MSMRAVFNDYHIMYYIYRHLTLLEMARLLEAFPCTVECFIRNRRVIVDAFDASSVSDLLTGVDWVAQHFGYKRVVRHLLDVDLGMWSGKWSVVTHVIGKDYRATFTAMLVSIPLDALLITELCRHGRAEMLMDALDFGFEIKCQWHNVKTSPLTVAVENGHTRIVELLLLYPEPHWRITIEKHSHINECWEIVSLDNNISMAVCLWNCGWKIASLRRNASLEFWYTMQVLNLYEGKSIDELADIAVKVKDRVEKMRNK